MTANYSIVPIEKKHLDGIVDVHMRAFPGFFLTFLGPRFLREFYASFTEDPAGVGFTALDDGGAVIGVVAGPQVPDGYFKRLLKRRWWAFCLASMTAVLKKPAVIRRLLRAVFYRGESPQGPPRALLSSLAVAPEYQKHGVGRALVQAWVEEVKNRKTGGCYLTTDAEGNDAVNRFYQRIGWTLESSYSTPEGRRMNRYVCDFSQPAGE